MINYYRAFRDIREWLADDDITGITTDDNHAQELVVDERAHPLQLLLELRFR